MEVWDLMLNFAAAMTKLWDPRTRDFRESAVKGWVKKFPGGHSRCTDVLAPELEVFVHTLESSIWADAAETLA